MAAKKSKKVSIELDVETLVQLVAATHSLSELASAAITGVDDPKVKAQLTKASGKKSK